MAQLIRAGDHIINLDNVTHIDLSPSDDGAPRVVFAFLTRGSDELVDGKEVFEPYCFYLHGDDAAAVRKYLKLLAPNLDTRQPNT